MNRFVIKEEERKYIISLYEQQIKQIDLTKDSVEQYCKKQVVPREIIDNEIPKMKDNIKKTISSKLIQFFQQNPEMVKIPGLKNLITQIINKVQERIMVIAQNNLYSYFGYGKYDDGLEKKNFIEFIYNEINNKINENFFIRSLMRTAINKKNILLVKKGVSGAMNFIYNILIVSLNLPITMSRNKIISLYYNTAQLCKNIVVTKDENYNVLPKEKQYNPKYPPLTVEPEYVDFKTILDQYITSIHKKLESYV